MQHETVSQSGDSTDSVETADDSPGGGVKTADLTDEAGMADVGPVPTFLHEIARTMQATADRERERIAANITDSLGVQVEMVRSRASTEAEELRRLAEADVDNIHEWSAAEVERVRREAEARIAARREALERHLLQHDALVEREITRATEAVEEYQNELGRFVGRLASEQEPTEIARLASQLPEPPRVEEIAAAAHADAIAELSGSEAAAGTASTTERDSAPVGVMDPSGVTAPAAATAQMREPAQTAAVASEDGEVAHEAQALTTADDVDLRLHAVLVVAVIVAIVLLLVITGQIHAASSSSPAQGI
jgi:hypothetical protein